MRKLRAFRLLGYGGPIRTVLDGTSLAQQLAAADRLRGANLDFAVGYWVSLHFLKGAPAVCAWP